jgi:23S rRNA G2445 N2-methylase RlmL
LIEAALLAGRVAPGLFRKRFGFERWPGHDALGFKSLVEAARREASLPKNLILRGWDVDPDTIEGARENLEAAGLTQKVCAEVGDISDFSPTRGWNAWIVTNPPYGERVGKQDELRALYRCFGRILSERCGGFHLALLSGNPALARLLGMTPDSVTPLKNGALDCELLQFKIPRVFFLQDDCGYR